MANYRIEDIDKKNLMEFLNRVPINKSGNDAIKEVTAFVRILDALGKPIEEVEEGE